MGVAGLLPGEMLQVGVGVVGRDTGSVAVFGILNPPVELVHATAACLDRGECIALAAFGGFSDGVQPLETLFAFGSVVELLAFVEAGGRWSGDEVDVF